MKIERLIQLMELERECVLRQDTTDCQRNVDPIRGCYGCPLVVNDSKEIVEAYDKVITILKWFSNIKEQLSKIQEEDNAMTLDEAVKHCWEKADELDSEVLKRANACDAKRVASCQECANEHRQLAMWLEELKQRRERDPNALS